MVTGVCPLCVLIIPNTNPSFSPSSYSGVNLNSTGSEWEVSQNVNPDRYNSYSAACAEVEIDVLTGEQNLTRVDILFDCGTSLNPIIDMGQVQVRERNKGEEKY